MANPGRVQGQSPGSGGQEAKPTEAESFRRLDVKVRCFTFASFVVVCNFANTIYQKYLWFSVLS